MSSTCTQQRGHLWISKIHTYPVRRLKLVIFISSPSKLADIFSLGIKLENPLGSVSVSYMISPFGAIAVSVG